MTTKKDDEVLCEIPRGEHSVVRLTVKTYENRRYLHVRLWCCTTDNPELRPTAKGITLDWDKAGELCKGFRKLEKLLEGASNESQPF